MRPNTKIQVSTRKYAKPNKLKKAREMRKKPTQAEALLWEYLRCKRMGGYKFRRQAIVRGYIVDFWCPLLGLAVEVDGGCHDLNYDTMRDIDLANVGATTLRLTNEEVIYSPQVAVLKIRETLTTLTQRS